MLNQLVKGLTLLLFVSAIGLFVAFRAGWFSASTSRIAGSPNGGALPVDTLQPHDSVPPAYFPSSKVVILNPPKLKVPTDTPKVKPDTLNHLEDPLIYSSKSGKVFRMEDIKLFLKDSLKTDSVR